MAKIRCKRCRGSGKVKVPDAAGCEPQYQDCPDCGGSGKVEAPDPPTKPKGNSCVT